MFEALLDAAVRYTLKHQKLLCRVICRLRRPDLLEESEVDNDFLDTSASSISNQKMVYIIAMIHSKFGVGLT